MKTEHIDWYTLDEMGRSERRKLTELDIIERYEIRLRKIRLGWITVRGNNVGNLYRRHIHRRPVPFPVLCRTVPRPHVRLME